jgi:hypothetical protein
MKRTILLLSVVFAGLVQCSFGSIITTGSFDISGTVFVTNPTASPVVTAGGTCPTAVACIFTQANGLNNQADISPSSLPNGDVPASIASSAGASGALVQPLTNPPESVGGAGFANQLWLSFNPAIGSGVTTTLMINNILAGIDGTAQCGLAAAAGQICTVAGSLFNFQNVTATSSTASWRFSGVTGDGTATWVATFTSQFNIPFQSVLLGLAINGFQSNTYSGTITLTPTNVTPEPGTLPLVIGAGLMGLSAVVRRRIVK